MNARLAHVLSRLSMASVMTASALGGAGCNGHASTTTPSVAEASPAETAPAATGHHPGQRIFREVRALDLRDDQRAAVDAIEAKLVADLSPHRDTLRQVAHFLASSLESGSIDSEVAADNQAALSAAILDVEASCITAMNGVHDVLDEEQRATLVAQLEDHAQRGVTRDAQGAEQPDGPIAKLAFELGLSDDQKASLREAVQGITDELFPDHKARREAAQAQMKAITEAFVGDDFDAANFDLGDGPRHSLASFGHAVGRVVDVSDRLLSASQRATLASLIRSHADSR